MLPVRPFRACALALFLGPYILSFALLVFRARAPIYIYIDMWTPAYTPTDHLTSWGVLYHPCTVSVLDPDPNPVGSAFNLSLVRDPDPDV